MSPKRSGAPGNNKPLVILYTSFQLNCWERSWWLCLWWLHTLILFLPSFLRSSAKWVFSWPHCTFTHFPAGPFEKAFMNIVSRIVLARLISIGVCLNIYRRAATALCQTRICRINKPQIVQLYLPVVLITIMITIMARRSYKSASLRFQRRFSVKRWHKYKVHNTKTSLKDTRKDKRKYRNAELPTQFWVNYDSSDLVRQRENEWAASCRVSSKFSNRWKEPELLIFWCYLPENNLMQIINLTCQMKHFLFVKGRRLQKELEKWLDEPSVHHVQGGLVRFFITITIISFPFIAKMPPFLIKLQLRLHSR